MSQDEAGSNGGIPFDASMFDAHHVDGTAVARRADAIAAIRVDEDDLVPRLTDAIRCIDLTTLSGDDTAERVRGLCETARQPLAPDLADRLRVDRLTTASVCVYPVMVPHAVAALEGSGVPVASVAAGFPAGLTPLHLRAEEVRWAVAEGAAEIDVVIARAHVLTGAWDVLHDEIATLREAAGRAHLKVILSTGELGTLDNVYAASVVAMQAGADFIKTSTGKEAVNATLPVGLVMADALRAYGAATGRRIGLKPAGGIGRTGDALAWQTLAERELGPPWRHPTLFRLGASSLLADIVGCLSARAREA